MVNCTKYKLTKNACCDACSKNSAICGWPSLVSQLSRCCSKVSSEASGEFQGSLVYFLMGTQNGLNWIHISRHRWKDLGERF